MTPELEALLREVTADRIARMFHSHYERLAPSFNYVTRKDSRVPFDDLPANNKALMLAVCEEVREWLEDCFTVAIRALDAQGKRKPE